MSAPVEIAMPQLSDSMEEGLVLQWLKAEGEHVSRGDELVEIETDKATMVHEADGEGVLQIVVEAGETVPVGALIARLGESAGAAVEPAAPPAPEPPPASAPVAGIAAGNGNPAGAPSAAATPVARRIAGAHGISLAELAGSGPRGRITKTDVLAAAGIAAPPAPAPAAGTAAPAPAAAPAAPAPQHSGEVSRFQEASRLQALIARRMTEAKATVPHFQVQTEVVFDRALAVREELKRLVAEGEPAPSVNDLIVKAAALALRAHPRANGSYTDGGFMLHDRVNVGIAVAAEGALVVPTVFDADTKPLGAIARETRELAARVRSGEITPAELDGGTFTVSNLGMYGMTAITPVINPPQAAILGVGAAREVLARVEGEIVDRSLLTLTLSCDHRILYGAEASQFLAEVKSVLEAPLKLTL